MNLNKAMLLILSCCLLLSSAAAFQYTLSTQNAFDQGTYVHTSYNSTNASLQLASGNTSGSYTSVIIDGLDVSQWNTLILTSFLPIEPLLLILDNRDDVWSSRDGRGWTFLLDNYNNGNGGDDAQFAFADFQNNIYSIEDDDDVWVSTTRGLTWTKINDDYNSEGQHVVRAAADYNNYLYIIEDDEDVWKSTDSGLNWTKVNGSDFNGGNGDPAGFVVNSSNTLLVVDNSEDVWASTDGLVWSFIANDFNGGESSDVDYLVIDGQDYLYAIENDDDIWQSTTGGFTWTKIRADYNGEGQHVIRATIDPFDNFYIIESDEDVWKSTDSGLNWTKVNGSDFNGGNGDVVGLFGFNSTTNISLQARSCALSDCGDSSFSETSSSLNLPDTRYLQFNLSFTADEQDVIPSVSTIILDYNDVGIPSVTNVLPQSANFPTNEIISLNATASDGRALDAVLINISLPDNISQIISLTNSSDSFYATSYIPLLPGNYIFTFLANDTSDNVNDSMGGQFSVIFSDTITPSVVADLCAPDPSTLGDNVQCNATITDNVQVATVFATVLLPNTTVVTPAISNLSTLYTFTINTSLLGVAQVSWIANDTSDNVNDTSSATFTTNPPNDLYGPIITPDSCIPDPATQYTDVTCNATITDDLQVDTALVNVTFSSGLTVEVSPTNISEFYTFSINASVEGSATVLWTANDSSNNVSFNNSQQFFVTSPPDIISPTITPGSCTPDPSTVGEDVTCDATITDNQQVASVQVNLTLPENTVVQPSVINSSDFYSFTYNASQIGNVSVVWLATDTSNNTAQDTNQQYTIVATNQSSESGSGSGSTSGSSRDGRDQGPGALRNAPPGTQIIGNAPQDRQTSPQQPSQPSQIATRRQQPRTTDTNPLTGAAVGAQEEGMTVKQISMLFLILVLLFLVISYFLRQQRRATKHLYMNKQSRRIMVKDVQLLDKLQGYVSAEVLDKLKKGDTLHQRRVDPKDKEFVHQFPETAKELQEKHIQVHPKKFNYERLEQTKREIHKENKAISATDMKKIFPETLGKLAKLQEERFVLTPRSKALAHNAREEDFSEHFVVKQAEKTIPEAPKQSPQTSRKINKTSKDDLLKGLQEVYKIE